MVIITLNIKTSQTINIVLFQNFLKLTISIKLKTKVSSEYYIKIISSEPGQSHNTIGQAGGRAELRV